MPQQVVDGGKVKVHLPCMFRLELASFQVDHYKASQFQVVEEQVKIVIVIADFQVILIPYESEAPSKFQEKPANVLDQPALNIAFVSLIAQGEKVELVRIFECFLREI